MFGLVVWTVLISRLGGQFPPFPAHHMKLGAVACICIQLSFAWGGSGSGCNALRPLSTPEYATSLSRI